ncbi:hypothetical protein CHS0354_015304 [Potamilus streckersoni]|uniref:Uncharacterized protein n=1 Tax=Potamilus streckersoni TaxID=2493646 RepID=A0AAE0RZZ5_9BIVA|nr:hypothetical protein CHS0354_015304 [Potamilus streckersoni]
MYPTTVGNSFVIPTVDVRTESFPDITVPPKKASNQESAASKINISASDTDRRNTSVVSKNGDTVENDVSNFNVNVFPNSSRLHLKETTTTNVSFWDNFGK